MIFINKSNYFNEDYFRDNMNEFNEKMVEEFEKIKKVASSEISSEQYFSSVCLKLGTTLKNNSIAEIKDVILSLKGLLEDWYTSENSYLSRNEAILILAGLIYVVTPTDLLPDWLGPIGYIDDTLVVSIIVETLGEKYIKYRRDVNG